MAKILAPYDRTKNVKGSMFLEEIAENAIAAGESAGLEVKCEVKVVPTDIFGNILLEATVTLNEVSGKVADCKNIAYVAPKSEVTYKIELEGFETVEGTLASVSKDTLVHVTLPFMPALEG